MSYENFKSAVLNIIQKAGGNICVSFAFDEDAGKFNASLEDGTIITGNRISQKMTVRFGSGHQAMTTA